MPGFLGFGPPLLPLGRFVRPSRLTLRVGFCPYEMGAALAFAASAHARSCEALELGGGRGSGELQPPDKGRETAERGTSRRSQQTDRPAEALTFLGGGGRAHRRAETGSVVLD